MAVTLWVLYFMVVIGLTHSPVDQLQVFTDEQTCRKTADYLNSQLPNDEHQTAHHYVAIYGCDAANAN